MSADDTAPQDVTDETAVLSRLLRGMARRVGRVRSEYHDALDQLPCGMCDGTGVALAERWGRDADGAPMMDEDVACPEGCCMPRQMIDALDELRADAAASLAAAVAEATAPVSPAVAAARLRAAADAAEARGYSSMATEFRYAAGAIESDDDAHREAMAAVASALSGEATT